MITAVILAVEANRDGSATMQLGPYRGEGPGQAKLVVHNPPKHLDAAVGTVIWGDDKWIYVGNKRWAERLGYTRCQMVPTARK